MEANIQELVRQLREKERARKHRREELNKALEYYLKLQQVNYLLRETNHKLYDEAQWENTNKIVEEIRQELQFIDAVLAVHPTNRFLHHIEAIVNDHNLSSNSFN
jgi:hypothetical protein